MDNFFNTFSLISESEPATYLDCSDKFSSFGNFRFYELLKQNFKKGFLLDLDFNCPKTSNCFFNLKQGFSESNKPGNYYKNFRKFSLLCEGSDFFTFEAKLSQFSLENLKFNVYSNFAYFKNTKIYSSFNPYYTKSYSLSKIGFKYCGSRFNFNNRIEFEKGVNYGIKGIFFPNNYFFIGGFMKFGILEYNLDTLSLILGIKQEDCEFIFKNETFNTLDIKKISLNISQQFNEDISFAARYKFILSGRNKNERNKLEFGLSYDFKDNFNFKIKCQEFALLKTSTKLCINEYLCIVMNYHFNFRPIQMENGKERNFPLGLGLKINLI